MTTVDTRPPTRRQGRRKLVDWNLGDGRRPTDPAPVAGTRPPTAAPDTEQDPAPASVAASVSVPVSASVSVPPARRSGERVEEEWPAASDPSLEAPVMDPRMEERRAEVQRAVGRRRLRIAVGVAAAAAVGAAGLGVLHSSIAGVRHLSVTGPHPGTRAGLVAAAGVTPGEPLIDVSPGAVVARLEALPWVATATVARSWPSTLRISVTERHPVAQIPTGASAGGPVVLVDVSGRALGRAARPVQGLPLLVGAPAIPGVGSWVDGSPGAGRPPGSPGRDAVATPAALGRAATPVAAALALAAGLGGTDAIGADTVRAIALQDGTTVEATVEPGSITVLFGTPDALAAKITAARTMFASVHLAAQSVLDLSVPERPTVSLAPAGGSLTGGPSTGNVSPVARG